MPAMTWKEKRAHHAKCLRARIGSLGAAVGDYPLPKLHQTAAPSDSLSLTEHRDHSRPSLNTSLSESASTTKTDAST